MYSIVDRTADLLDAAGARIGRDSRGRYAEVPPPPAAEPHLDRDTNMRINFGTNPKTTVTLITILPNGSRLAAEDIEPERAVDHWRRAMAELRVISRALIDEHALRARTARITDSHWQEAGGPILAAPDPANPSSETASPSHCPPAAPSPASTTRTTSAGSGGSTPRCPPKTPPPWAAWPTPPPAAGSARRRPRGSTPPQPAPCTPPPWPTPRPAPSRRRPGTSAPSGSATPTAPPHCPPPPARSSPAADAL